MKWISIAEKAPSPGQLCVVAGRCRYAFIDLTLFTQSRQFEIMSGSDNNAESIRWWMPVPDIPEEDSKC